MVVGVVLYLLLVPPKRREGFVFATTGDMETGTFEFDNDGA